MNGSKIMGKKVKSAEKKSAILRASFVKVFKDGNTKYAKDGKKKFTMMCLIPKSVDSIGVRLTDDRKKQLLSEAKDFYKSLKAELRDVAEKAFPDDDVDEMIDRVIKDGDKVNTRKKKKDAKPLAPGYFYFDCSTMFKPTVFRPKAGDGQIDDDHESELFSGCWVRIFYNVYSYDGDENSGVSIGLGNIKKCYEDDKLGGEGGGSFDDDDDVEELEPEDDDFESSAEEEDDEPWE